MRKPTLVYFLVVIATEQKVSTLDQYYHYFDFKIMLAMKADSKNTVLLAQVILLIPVLFDNMFC